MAKDFIFVSVNEDAIEWPLYHSVPHNKYLYVLYEYTDGLCTGFESVSVAQSLSMW